RGPGGLTGDRQEPAAVVPHRRDDGAHPRFTSGVTPAPRRSHGGEGVVAELGQDVAGPADDLAGLRQGGALAVLAVLDGGVVAMVGGGGFPASNPPQASPGGPCRDRWPGERLPSEEQAVMSSPANRTALRAEVNRPAPPSQQVSASAVTGPTPQMEQAR